MGLDELMQYILNPVAHIALIIGLAEVAKRLGLKKKYIPVLDLILGVLFGVLICGLVLHYGIIESVFVGIFNGLSACGLFSGVKNVLEKEDNENEGY